MYIPKNRIKTNLYTPGNEFLIKLTGEDYMGYYHSLYTGKFYTGKTQNDSNIREIIRYEVPELEGTPSLPQNLEDTNVIALFLNDPDPLIDEDKWNQSDVVKFLELNGKSTIDDDPKNVPFQSYPKPTKEDYTLGSFTRYFAVKVNENRYLELDLDTYKKLKKRDANWTWELWNCFSVQWTLTGNADQVALANKNQILIAEQRLKKAGLTLFLRGDYLKFYQSN
jgi:hypothetical protein